MTLHNHLIFFDTDTFCFNMEFGFPDSSNFLSAFQVCLESRSQHIYNRNSFLLSQDLSVFS